MKKRSIAGILAAVICTAALIYIFLWPHPLYDIAWLGVGRDDPDIVRIERVTPGEGEVGTYDVTLSMSDSAAFLEDMRDASARFPIPGRMGSITRMRKRSCRSAGIGRARTACTEVARSRPCILASNRT